MEMAAGEDTVEMAAADGNEKLTFSHYKILTRPQDIELCTAQRWCSQSDVGERGGSQ